MSALRHPLWRKAPTRLIRYPALLGAIAVGAMLVAVVATAYPLFLSASNSDLLTSTIERPAFTPYGSGLAYRSTDIPFDAVGPTTDSLEQERDAAFEGLRDQDPGFGPVVESLAAPPATVRATGQQATSGTSQTGRLFAGTDVLDHVRIVSGTDGDGVWLPDGMANTLGVGPGDTVQLRGKHGTADVEVDGIYVALTSRTPDGYWQIWQDQLQPGCSDCSPPPQFILADRDQLIDLQQQLGEPTADQAFIAPARTDPPMTVDQARSLDVTIAELEDEMVQKDSFFGRLFPCCGVRGVLNYPTGTSEISNLSDVLKIVEGRSVGLRGPAAVLLLAGLTLAFVVVAAGGVFAFSSRPSEAALLSVRGWGPMRVAVKAVVESAIPVVVGVAVGFVFAYALVLSVGPNGPVEPSARTTALLASAAAAVGALVMIAVVNAGMFAVHHEHKHHLTRAALWVPWELLAFGALVLLGRSLHTGGGLVGTGEVQRPGAPVFLYAIAFAAAVGILVARAAAGVIVWRARAPGGDRVSARWLALRRTASSVRLAAVFLIAAAIAVSVSVSAQGLVSSLRATAVAKAKIFVGSDVQAQVVPGAADPTDFPYPITLVEVVPDAGFFDDVSTSRFELLVIDPSTFANAAYWNGALADVPLDELVRRLDADDGDTLPVVLANGTGVNPRTITVGVAKVPVSVVGRASSFPGSTSLRPVIVVSRDTALRIFPSGFNLLTMGGSNTEVWVRGDADPVIDALAGSPIQPFTFLTADQVRDVPYIVAAVNTFLTLDVLGVMALILIVVLAVGYVQVRERPRIVESGLSARMGVPRALLRRALLLELGGILVGAILIGVPTGLIASAVVLDALDPLAQIPPSPFFVDPWSGVIAACLFLLLAAVVGAWLVDRAARRADLAEVMRVAG